MIVDDSSNGLTLPILGPGGTEQTPTDTLSVTPTDTLSLPAQPALSENPPIGKILLVGVVGIGLYLVLTKS